MITSRVARDILRRSVRMVAASPAPSRPRPPARTLVTSGSGSNRQPSAAKTEVLSEDNEDYLESKARELERELVETAANKGLSKVADSRVDMPQVGRELFMGRLEPTILSYPDVLENDRYHALEARTTRLRQFLDSKGNLVDAIDKEGRISKDIKLPLRGEHALHGLRGPDELGGQELCYTEVMRILEELSRANLSLGEWGTAAGAAATAPLERFGTGAAKAKYLPKLYSGEWTGAVCSADDACGSDPASTTCRALGDKEEGYRIKGTKRWVTNGADARVFTVLAKTMGRSEMGDVLPVLSAFVVERDSPGVTVGPEENVAGMRGTGLSWVRFDEAQVPPANLLGAEGMGFQIYTECHGPDRVLAAAKVSALLRELLNATIAHVALRRAFGRPLCDFDLVKHRLSQAAARIYALEAAAYMTAGLGDVQKEEDLLVESSLTKLFASAAAREVTDHCLTLLGGRGYLTAESEPFLQAALDLRAFDLWEGPTDLLRIAVAMEGLIHAGREIPEEIRKLRNPMLHPVNHFRRSMEQRWLGRDNPKYKLKLFDHVHQSLGLQAEAVEYSLLRLGFATERALVWAGQNIGTKELPMMRLADAAAETYAMLSATARANRSYCHGHAHGDHELSLSMLACFEGRRRAKDAVDRVLLGYSRNLEYQTTRTADYMLENGSYVATHPTLRNVF